MNVFSNEQPVPMASAALEIAKLVGRCLESEVTINEMLKMAARSSGLEKIAVLMPDRSSGKLRASYGWGANGNESYPGEGLSNEGIAGRVMATSQIAVLPRGVQDAVSAYRIVSPRQTDVQIDNVSLVALPIVQSDQAVGALVAKNGAVDSSSARELLQLLQMTSVLVSQVLYMSDLMKKKQATDDAVNSSDFGLEGAGTREARVFGILGYSPALRKSIEKALRASQSDATVLMVGESGSGKERFARMVHLASDRCDGPFVCVNCAAIPQDLLESELFGHEKGSFTGATSTRQGKFELADHGTLFLDEIGDMDLDLQAKLLRTLQDKYIQRVGGSSEIATDVRIISATNRNLEELVKQETFRLDLYFRLNVLKIQLPSLRERRGDIRMLALYFLTRENQRYRRNLVLTGSALERLEGYDWPGNVRQLENVVERAVIMAEQELIFAEDIESLLKDELVVDGPAVVAIGAGGLSQHHGAPSRGNGATEHVRPYQRVDAVGTGEIVKAIDSAKGNKTLAARNLGLTPRQLHYRLSKLGLREQFERSI